jgi:ABC-type dipeptide/oligopeptide/nickel transport system permease subunit
LQAISEIEIIEPELAELPPDVNEWRRFSRVFFGRKVVLFSSIVIFVIVVTAIVAPLIAPYDPYKAQLRDALQPPSLKHLLGTDPLGRDVFSRIIYGTRISLQVGLIAVGIAACIGTALGLVAGYFSGWPDGIIMRLMDGLLAIPPLMLALAIAAVLGGGLTNIMISLGVALLPTYSRLMRGMVLSVKETDYVTAARVTAASNVRIMLVDILPNCIPPMIVLITMNMGTAILAEAALSFLGLGIAPPGAAWGSMVNDGYKYLLMQPLLSLAPGVCIMLVVLSFNMVGDGLRDALDPRLRGVI